MGEPKKFTFGFSKVAKKPALLTPKPVETVDYIKCVEDKSVKLVNEEHLKPKPLPVIPMPKGSSVKDRILDAIKAREDAKHKVENGQGESELSKAPSEPMTLDEMAAKELIEGATNVEEKKEDLVIAADAEASRELSTLDDYENMPISDFGQAMLRGMGWDPKKGIGLSEKVVVPSMPQVRPKGMGLGADKSMSSQKSKPTDENAVMKKGSMVKVISGPHNQLYGKIEAFEELPGRILVRLTLSNEIVSMGEFMVQLVPLSEYSKNAKVMNLDKYRAALTASVKEEEREEKFSRRKSDYGESRTKSNAKNDKYSNSSDDRVKKFDSRRDDSRDFKEKLHSSDERKKSSHHKKKKSKRRSSSESSGYEKRSKRGKKHSKRKDSSDSDSSSDKRYKKHKKNRK